MTARTSGSTKPVASTALPWAPRVARKWALAATNSRSALLVGVHARLTDPADVGALQHRPGERFQQAARGVEVVVDGQA